MKGKNGSDYLTPLVVELQIKIAVSERHGFYEVTGMIAIEGNNGLRDMFD